jgi:mannose-6-phosphate isomerase
MRTTQTLGPITLEPIFQERIWGVDALPAWYQRPETTGPIGEVWLTAETCLATDGPHPGQSLADLTRLHPQAFGAGHDAQFPLLIKVLLPREKLSVQVHPNDAEAQLLGQPRGKTECWYILSAEPGAAVAVGFKEPLTPGHIRAAIENNTLESKLRYLPVRTGDMVFVDAGTVHAIGPGMIVLETQQYSDVTYRLYDYGRPRELHVDAGLAVSKNSLTAGLVGPRPDHGFTHLVQSDYFEVDRFPLTANNPLALGRTTSLQILVALESGCTLRSTGTIDTASTTTHLTPGRAVLLPAEDILYTLHGSGEVIRISQP